MRWWANMNLLLDERGTKLYNEQLMMIQQYNIILDMIPNNSGNPAM